MADEISRERMADQARLAAAILAQGRSLDQWSLIFTGLALAALLVGGEPALAGRSWLPAAVLSGLLQKYFAVRVGLDRELFRSWTERWQRQGADPCIDLESLDQSLATLGLAKGPGNAASRSLPERVHGALRLFRRQVLLFALQAILLVIALVAG